MQSVELMHKKGKRQHRHHPEVLNKTKEESFNNRWSLNEKAKAYQALSDPYTSYYFSNKAVKDHLKQFKRAIRYEPNFTEKTRINKLITIRMKQKFEDFLCPKTSIYEQSLGETDLKKINQKSSKSISTQRLSNFLSPKQTTPITPAVFTQKSKPLSTRKDTTQRLPKIKNDTISHSRQSQTEDVRAEPNVQSEKERTKKASPKHNDQKLIADRLAEELHQKKHDKWLIFLEQKKKMLVARENPATEVSSGLAPSPIQQEQQTESKPINNEIVS